MIAISLHSPEDSILLKMASLGVNIRDLLIVAANYKPYGPVPSYSDLTLSDLVEAEPAGDMAVFLGDTLSPMARIVLMKSGEDELVKYIKRNATLLVLMSLTGCGYNVMAPVYNLLLESQAKEIDEKARNREIIKKALAEPYEGDRKDEKQGCGTGTGAGSVNPMIDGIDKYVY